jgi:hypothetical protein
MFTALLQLDDTHTRSIYTKLILHSLFGTATRQGSVYAYTLSLIPGAKHGSGTLLSLPPTLKTDTNIPLIVSLLTADALAARS